MDNARAYYQNDGNSGTEELVCWTNYIFYIYILSSNILYNYITPPPPQMRSPLLIS